MRRTFTTILSLILFTALFSCKKDKNKKVEGCPTSAQTVRVIKNKTATVKVTATAVAPAYLVEDGTIDTKLIPCNLPLEFYMEGLRVTISGEVKATASTAYGPCCWEDFVITEISR